MSLRLRSSRHATSIALAMLAMLVASVLVTAGPAAAATAPSLDWAFKTSWRNYVLGVSVPGAGTITATAPAADAGAPDSVSTFPESTATIGDDGLGTVAYDGAVRWQKPNHGIDVTLTDPSIEISSATGGVLTADLGGGRVPVANLTWTAGAVSEADGVVTVSGANATLASDAAGAFTYAAGEVLAPLTFSYTAPEPEPEPEPVAPSVTVSKTTDLDGEGETVTITGTGFVPNAPATTATRAPLCEREGMTWVNCQFGGAYVVFGNFPDTWKPSAGVPSTARTVIEQRWAVDASNVDALGAEAVALNADGSFEVTLNVSDAQPELTGNYGIYTYPGSGAVYAPFETYTPITFAEPEPDYGIEV
ncbi:HtaA domain-containing protein, partial [Demequina sp. NBRC 110056]|uniref:HtaA domain-containing protein n=1 Tax=Demequina sp. NBRC 110056 TaxID=1570345 RepID=UPI00190E634B